MASDTLGPDWVGSYPPSQRLLGAKEMHSDAFLRTLDRQIQGPLPYSRLARRRCPTLLCCRTQKLSHQFHHASFPQLLEVPIEIPTSIRPDDDEREQ